MAIVNRSNSIVENPLAVLGFNRDVFDGLEREQVMRLVSTMYQARMKTLSLKAVSERPDNPRNGGDALKWRETEARLSRERERLSEAYTEISDPANYKRLMQHYRPMNPDEEVAQARAVVAEFRKELKAFNARARDSILSLARHDPRSVRDCGPCTIEISDIGSALNFKAAFGGAFEEVPFARFAKEVYRKELHIEAGGKIQGSATENRLFAVLQVPRNLSVPKLLTAVGLKVPPSSLLLEHQDTAPDTPRSRDTYRTSGIPVLRNKLAVWDTIRDLMPFVSTLVEPSTKEFRSLLLSVSAPVSMSAFLDQTQMEVLDSQVYCTIEGEILSLREAEPAEPVQSVEEPAPAPTEEKKPAKRAATRRTAKKAPADSAPERKKGTKTKRPRGEE